MRRAVLCIGLLAAAALVHAQAARGPGPGGRPREELFRMIDAYILSNLQESVGLSDEQFVKVLPLVKRLQGDRRSFIERRHEWLLEMRRLLETGRATEPRIGELLRDIKGLEADEPGILRRDLDALDAQLTPLQQAKLRVLQAEVEQKIRDLMARVRAGQGGRRRDGLSPGDPGGQ